MLLVSPCGAAVLVVDVEYGTRQFNVQLPIEQILSKRHVDAGLASLYRTRERESERARERERESERETLEKARETRERERETREKETRERETRSESSERVRRERSHCWGNSTQYFVADVSRMFFS